MKRIFYHNNKQFTENKNSLNQWQTTLHSKYTAEIPSTNSHPIKWPVISLCQSFILMDVEYAART